MKELAEEFVRTPALVGVSDREADCAGEEAPGVWTRCLSARDCRAEVRIGVLGKGLWMMGGVENFIDLNGAGEAGVDESLVSCVGEMGSYGTKTFDWGR